MTETRKIAAILAADVVGYSRLTGTDEDCTLARLRALRSDLIDPTIAVHNGRVVKRTGDGALVEFRSVVDAVRCAIEVQNGMLERNAGLPPEGASTSGSAYISATSLRRAMDQGGYFRTSRPRRGCRRTIR
jgi:adenylate cyclase